MSAFLRS